MKNKNYLNKNVLLLTCGLLLSLGHLKAADCSRKVLAADYQTKRIAIVNNSGEIEWEYPIKNIHDLHLLPNGNILFQTDWHLLVELTPEKQVVWSYDSSKMNGNEGKRVEVHAFQRLENGWTLIAESGPSRIIEVDTKGTIQRSFPLEVSKSDPHRDTRLVRKLENGHYLVCHEGDGRVKEYDCVGKVVWNYNAQAKVYSAVRRKNGNTLVTTGDGHSVIEVNPQGETVWSVTENELPGIRLTWITTVEELANGNIVIGNCHAGPDNPQLVEITREKKVVWTFKDFKTFGNALPTSQILGETSPSRR